MAFYWGFSRSISIPNIEPERRRRGLTRRTGSTREAARSWSRRFGRLGGVTATAGQARWEGRRRDPAACAVPAAATGRRNLGLAGGDGGQHVSGDLVHHRGHGRVERHGDGGAHLFLIDDGDEGRGRRLGFDGRAGAAGCGARTGRAILRGRFGERLDGGRERAGFERLAQRCRRPPRASRWPRPDVSRTPAVRITRTCRWRGLIFRYWQMS